jgi:hypothetical protein
MFEIGNDECSMLNAEKEEGGERFFLQSAFSIHHSALR